MANSHTQLRWSTFDPVDFRASVEALRQQNPEPVSIRTSISMKGLPVEAVRPLVKLAEDYGVACQVTLHANFEEGEQMRLWVPPESTTDDGMSEDKEREDEESDAEQEPAMAGV